MKGNRKAYTPVSATREINDVKDVFRQDEPSISPGISSDPLILTSVRVHASVKNAVKAYAAEKGLKMHEVVESALKQYVGIK